MENVKEALQKSMMAEIDAIKQRNIALIYAVQGMERERIGMYSALFDGNRCQDCARHTECANKKDEKSTYKEKMKNPESFCAAWEYAGKYTPVNEILIMARDVTNGRSEGG